MTVKPLLSTSATPATNTVHIITSSILSQEYNNEPVTESQLNLSSTHSIQLSTDLLSSNLSSQEPSQLPSTPPEDTVSIVIHFAFLVLLILVSVFVLLQCSHFIVYIARQAFKDRNSGQIRKSCMNLIALFIGRKLPDFIRLYSIKIFV